MKTIKTRDIDSLQKKYIYKLWNEEYPSTIVYGSISQLDDYLDSLTKAEHYFLMDEDTIAGWAITFRRDNEKWFAIIIDKDFQGKGLGSGLLNHLRAHNAELNGWIINEAGYFKADGSPYKTPLEFYLKNGFKLVENTRLDIPQIKAVKICWCR